MENTIGIDFDPTQVDPSNSDNVPNGWYNCEIVSAESKPSKGAGGNLRLNLGFKIIGEQFTGRQFFTGLNHKHTNTSTQEWAQRDLSAICHATGVMSFATAGFEQFVGKLLQVKVGTGKPTTAYPDPQNEGKGYKAIDGAANPGFAQGGASPAVATPAFAQPPAAVAPEQVAQPATIPPAQPGAAPAPPAPPVAVAPVVNPLELALADGWLANPNGPGWYYNAAGEQLSEADLIARYLTAPPVVAAPPAPPAPPVAPTQQAAPPAQVAPQTAAPAPVAPAAGGVPAAATGAPPAWATQ